MQDRTIVSTRNAPSAIGPYSQAVCAAGLVYTSGQIPLDPASGEVTGADVAAQTRQVLMNLSAVLEAAGSSLEQVLKTTVFLTDLGQFQQMNEVYAEFFTHDQPARSTIQVSALPKGALVEIEAVALAD